MKNPPQTDYSLEELFRLKPEIIKMLIANSATPVAPVIKNSAPVTADTVLKKHGFCGKYKVHIIAGSIIIAIVGVIWYFENEKKKNKEKKNLPAENPQQQ